MQFLEILPKHLDLTKLLDAVAINKTRFSDALKSKNDGDETFGDCVILKVVLFISRSSKISPDDINTRNALLR